MQYNMQLNFFDFPVFTATEQKGKRASPLFQTTWSEKFNQYSFLFLIFNIFSATKQNLRLASTGRKSEKGKSNAEDAIFLTDLKLLQWKSKHRYTWFLLLSSDIFFCWQSSQNRTTLLDWAELGWVSQVVTVFLFLSPL